MPLSENEWHMAAITTPCSLLSLTGHILWCFSPIALESRGMLQRESQASALQRRKTTVSLSKSPLHVCYINMPRAIASQKTSWGISSSATLLRLCSTARSQLPHSLLVVSNTFKPQMNSALPNLQGLREATKKVAVDTGKKDFRCWRENSELQPQETSAGKHNFPLWKRTAPTVNPEHSSEEVKDCCSESLSRRVRRELIS